jgi:hypothetical protein
VGALLDTSIVVNADVGPIEGELAISAAILSELHFGVLVAKSPGVRAKRLMLQVKAKLVAGHLS